jgi:hypothetical protein
LSHVAASGDSRPGPELDGRSDHGHAGVSRAAIRVSQGEYRDPARILPGLAPWFDEVLPLDSYGRGTAALIREARSLRARRFDLGICLPDSFSSALLMRLGGVRRIVGYRRNGRGALLHRPVAPPRAVGRRIMIPREQHVLGLIESVDCAAQGTELEPT